MKSVAGFRDLFDLKSRIKKLQFFGNNSRSHTFITKYK